MSAPANEPRGARSVFDEAHRVRRSMQGSKVSTTQAYRLADELKELVDGVLLLTATPMQLDPYELAPGMHPVRQISNPQDALRHGGKVRVRGGDGVGDQPHEVRGCIERSGVAGPLNSMDSSSGDR